MLARLPRIPLACAASFALVAAPATALAGNDQAPGALKKQETTTTTAPAPAVTTTVSPAPQQSRPAPAPTSQPKSSGNVPVTKGTLKKVVQTQPSSAPTTYSTTTTRRARTRTTARTRQHSFQGGTTAPARRSSGTARAHSRRAVLGAAAAGSGTTATTRARGASAVAAPVHSRGHKPVAARHVKAKKVAAAAPLASISRAADRVIEVIPGAVLLALGGLAGLVFVLIVRNLQSERRRSKALAQSYGVTVEALATAIEAKDHTTGGHIERVRKLGLLLAGEIAPRDARDPQMAYGFLLHDIGKLAVPDAILRAPGRLTEDEWALMRRHPEEGVRMLSHVPFLDRALDVVRHHHERWDGGGYPEGLAGQDIPLWARIFSVVDALDAMTAERPYRPARPYEAALEEIRRHAGTQFDPAVVEALEALDPAVVEPLLEPTQQLDPELAEVTPLEPLVAA